MGYEDKFIDKIEIVYTNIQSKTKKMVSYRNLLPYMRSSPGVSTLILLYVTVAEVAATFTDANARIKGAQIGDRKIKH